MLLGAARNAAQEQEPPDGRAALRGRAIREAAVELLVRRGPAAGPIHYRRWLALVEETGCAVAGRRPEAVFYSQVTRHPLVRRATLPGFYELDSAAPERLESRVAALRSSLATATEREARDHRRKPEDPGGSREAFVELARAERLLAEARAAMPRGAACGR